MQRRGRFLLGAVLALGLLLAITSSASALTLGLNWDGNAHSQTELLNETQGAGATVYHVPLEYGGSWVNDDNLVEEAWKRGITIVPTIGSSKRFILSSNPEWSTWGAWARAAVERYGYGGTFWAGKTNPTPIPAWEVWNEPNLAANNPVRTKTECTAEGLLYHPPAEEEPGTCIQPKAYGTLLGYTASQIQAGSVARTGHGTEVLMGGIATEVGEAFGNFYTNASSTAGTQWTGVAIHPYSFTNGVEQLAAEIAGAHSYIGSKTFWITELGWPVAGTFPVGEHSTPHVVTEAEQASLLTGAFNWIKAHASTYNIQNVDWYNTRDFGGKSWVGWCGLLQGGGTPRASYYAFQQEAGKPAPATIGVITNSGTAFAKSGNLFGEWVEEFGGVKSVSVASDAVTGPVVGVLTNSGVGYVKAGDIRNPWVKEFGGIKEIKVATDSTHGPLIGIVTNGGVAWVKYGLSGEWVEELGSVKSLSVATDAINGPLIGVVTSGGKAYVKQGNLRNTWVEEVPAGMKSIAVASDPVSGPTVAVLSESGTVVAKTGSLYGEWVEEFGGIKSVSVASDAIDGPVLGVVTTSGVGWAKQGNLRNEWVEEFGGVTALEVSADPISGPFLGTITSTGVAYVKQGGLRSLWLEESPSISSLSVGG